MKIKVKKLVCMLIALAVCISLCGCLSASPDDMYQLPKSSEVYVQLQQKINEIQSGGAEFSAPLGGYNRQAIQLYDIDSDGDEEAVAFFRNNDDKPLHIYILKKVEEKFEVVAAIDGDVTAVDSISYVDMNADGVSEIAVGWQMSASVKMMSIYSVKDYQPVQLSVGGYSSYTYADMNGESDNEVILINTGTTETAGNVTMYALMDDGEMVSYTAHLSMSAETISRTQTGFLADKHRAVYIDSVCGSGLITDVVAFKNDALINITLEEETQNSVTERPYSIYCQDINSDGIIEIPAPQALFKQSDTNYYAVNWNTCTSRGFVSLRMTTYHNFSDGWYLIIPSEWAETMTIRREDRVAGERAVVFSMVTDEGNEEQEPVLMDFLKLYSLTGDNKEDKASVSGRFVLRQEEEQIYAACILENGTDIVTEQYLKDNFRIIHSDWLSGTF